ncbi:MAG TPA: YggT family protein [Chloroflexota bacterium]|nr:YggT family protein [Chloroflexota bacterium]
MNIQTILYDFVGWLGMVLSGAIIIRVLLSWFSMGNTYGPVFRLLDDVTEPILRPLRRVIPTIGMFDLSPIVAILLINFISSLIQAQIAR